ncbi:MAG: GxxExxY protein [Patescibacteria group bacterium]
MPTDTQTGKKDFLYCDLTYKINGIIIEVHKELGAYAREKQFGDLLEKKFKERHIVYEREVRIGESGNIADFIIDGKIVLELKAQPFLIVESYDQVKRYLIQTNLQLGLLVNFRGQRVQIKRVLNPNNY